MTAFPSIRRWFESWFRRDRLERSLDEELRFHLDMETEAGIRAGLSPADARCDARRRFGSMAWARDECRDSWARRSAETLGQDVPFALRGLRRNPGFAAAAILTLALGVGANAAIFSVVNAVLLQPLPFPRPDRLFALCSENRVVAGFCVASPPDVEDMRQASRTIAGLGLARSRLFLHRTPAGAEGLLGGLATPALFRVLGVAPALGRLLEPADLQSGRNTVIVLSHAVWESRFGGDSGAIGRTLRLDGRSYRIVGVLPAGFSVPQFERVQFWTPLPFDPRDEANRDWRGFVVYGRLAPGATIDAAQSDLAAIAAQLARAHPKTDAGWGVRVEPLLDQVVGPVRRTLIVFLGAVGLVLLIGCANVANLLLARASARRRELAVRIALGGSRRRLVRMLLTEGVVLAALGSAAGLLLAFAGVRAFLALAPAGIPRLGGVVIDQRVLVFAALVGLASSVLFGTLPALRASRVDVSDALKDGRRTGIGRGLQLRGTLIVAEVALALMLLVGAGLLLRSFVALVMWQPGFEQQHLLTLQIFVPEGKYPRSGAVGAFYRRALGRLSSFPGVVSAGAASSGPLFGGRETDSFTIDGAPAGTRGDGSPVRWFDVSPGYFPTMGIPIVAGRDFTDRDGPGAPPVAIVNEAMARRYWPGTSPLDDLVTLKEEKLTVRIVGVVRDVPPFYAGEPVGPEIYWPDYQHPRWATFLVIRTAGTPARLAPDIRHLLARVEPDLDVTHVNTMPELVARQLVRPRFTALLIGVFAVMAVFLAAVGIYGVTAYAVAQRTREFGIRLALGAEPAQVVRTVLREGMLRAFAGIALGLAGALALSRVLTGLLTGIQATDPATLVVVSGLAALMAVAATYLPARRASRVDPMAALRSE